MLAITTKKAIYGSVLFMGLIALAFGGLGLARAAGNSQSKEMLFECQGVVSALMLVESARELDISDAINDELDDVIDDLEDAVEAHEDGDFDEVQELVDGVMPALRRLANTDHADLTDLMLDALNLLDECETPEPDPSPQPGSHIVYSAKFVCGGNTTREAMVTPNFGRQPYLFNRGQYHTEVNVHNYHLNRAVVWGQVMVANSHDEPRGRVSPLTRRVIRPNEAFKVDCRDIREALGTIDTDVCQGKVKALETLMDILERPASDLVSEELMEAIKEAASMLERSIALEKEGEHDEALELDRMVVERLNELIERAESAGIRRLVRPLTEARNLVRRCMVSVTDEIDLQGAKKNTNSIRPARLPALVEGFVVIRTPSQLEVTGVYRVTAHNKTVSGGIGSGASIDVEQISPHRTRGPIPSPADLAQ